MLLNCILTANIKIKTSQIINVVLASVTLNYVMNLTKIKLHFHVISL